MSFKEYFKFDYKLNRRLHGPVISAFLALRTALKPVPF